MGLESAIEKLDKYFARLEKGKARQIKPSHVEKVIGKLDLKAESLREELDETAKASKKQRLQQKLALIDEQKARARWLLDRISNP